MSETKPKVNWVALYPPQQAGTRWYYNVALNEGIGCGDLTETATDASAEFALADFRRVLTEHFDMPAEFDFETGERSWGATFARS